MRFVGMFCVDFSLIVAATLLAILIRDDFALSLERLQGIAPYLAATMAAAATAIPIFGLHRSIWRLAGQGDLERIACATVVTVVGAAAVCFVVDRLDDVPPSLPFFQFVLILALMFAGRGLARRLHGGKGSPWYAFRRSDDATRSTVLLVGVNPVSELYLRCISELGQGEIEVAGALGRNSRQVGRQFQSCRVLGQPEDIGRVIHTLEIEGIVVDRVAVAVPARKLSVEARLALSEVERLGISVYFLADRIGLGLSDAAVSVAGEDWRAVSNPEYSVAELRLLAGRRYLRIKRLLDVVGAAVLLIAALPVLLVVALLVAYDVGLPIVFRQRRPGLRGRAFKLYKFRTMGRAFNAAGDRIDDNARSSGIGRFLRRTRLDELPQFYNVLIGDMSFVGPRPLLPIDQRPEFKARLLVKPGITGWAQIEGGRIVEAVNKAAMDVWYVQNASLLLDLRILLKTVPSTLRGDRVNAMAVERAWNDLKPTGICSGWVRQPTFNRTQGNALRVGRSSHDSRAA